MNSTRRYLIPYINPSTTKPIYKFLRNAEQSRQWGKYINSTKVFNQKTEKYEKYAFMTETTTEIDVRKAYTHAFNQITEIPVFNLTSLIYGSSLVTKPTITASFTN